MGEGEGRRGNTGRARARCGNVAELSDVGPRTAADRGKWVAAVVAVVVILVGRRIQQFSTPRQSSHILHTLTYSMSPILHSVDSHHSFIHHPSTMNIFSTRQNQQGWMLGLLSIRKRTSSQPVHSLSSLLHYNKIREQLCRAHTYLWSNNELMQLLFLYGHHLEPEVHTFNVPTCVESFLVQGTSYTSISPNHIACTVRSMIAWDSVNAVIMCKAHKTSSKAPLARSTVYQILMIRLSQHRKRGTRRDRRYLRRGADNSGKMLPYSLRFKNLAAKHSNLIWLEESWLFP